MNVDVRASRWTRPVIAALVLLFAAAGSAAAAPEISSVEAKVEKRKNQTSGRDEAWVIVTYTATDIPAGGTQLTMEASFTSKNDTAGIPFTITPGAQEMQGAIGLITSDGKKTIEWQAERTLVRLNKQGKYTTTVALELEGAGGATQAVLNVTKYAKTNWNYFQTGTAIITNLSRTNGFQPECTPRGGNWHDSVEAGAVFYKGTVTSIPSWRGRRVNDPIKGSYDRSGCSAFLAIKDRGTPNEKIWVNFARHFDGKLTINGTTTTVDWEFQFRYIERKKDNFKSLVAGNAGDADDNGFVLWDTGEEFSLKLEGAPADKEQSSEFELLVPRRDYKHSYQGEHMMTFVAEGDGYFDSDDSKPHTLVLKDGGVKVNDWLSFEGSMEIDTSASRMTTNGQWSTPSNGMLFNGPMVATLNRAIDVVPDSTLPFPMPLPGQRPIAAPSALPKLSSKWNIGGFSLSFEKLRFVGGAESASGIEFDLRILIEQLSSGCAFDIKKDPLKAPGASIAGFLIKGVQMTRDGWSISGVEAQNVGIASAPVFCLKSFKANYDKGADKLTAELIAKGPIFDDIGGGLTLVNGEIDGFRIIMKLAGGGVPIPYPPPPAHVAEWRGFDASVLNVRQGPYTLDGKMFFSNNGKWKELPPYQAIMNTLNKLPGVSIDDVKLYDADGTAKYVHGESFNGGFALRMFSLKKDVWLMQGDVDMAIQLNPSLFTNQISGGLKVLNFGGSLSNQWMFDGRVTAGLSILPDFNVGGSITGELQVPQLYRNNPVFTAINDWFALPWKIGGASATMNNLQFSVRADIPRYGIAEVAVDLGKNPLTEPTEFMRITNSGNLPRTRLKGNGGRSALGADTAWSQFTVTADMERAFVQIWGTPSPRNSVLIDPSGRLIAGTSPDQSVVFYPSEKAGQSAMWVVMSPAPGQWSLGIAGGTDDDSVYTWGRYRDMPAFTFASETQGRTIVARWSGATVSPNATMNLYIDNDQEGYDGAFIGTVPAALGEFRYTLSDSLPECGYYIYAMRIDTGSLTKAYSPVYHANAKSWLAAPGNIQAVATPAGDVTVTWSPSPDPKALTYAIQVSDPAGHDSVYATVNLNYTMVQIHVENWQNKKISIRTLGEENLSGCWSDPVSFTLSGVEDAVTGNDRTQGAEVAVSPHPVGIHSTVFVNLERSTQLSIELYTATGEKVATLAEGTFGPGTARAELMASELPNGVYFVRIAGDGINASRKIIVRH